MMTRMRHEFSTRTKLYAFLRSNGKCERCGVRLRPGDYRYDHDSPDWMGGDNSLENCVVACRTCDTPKTANDQRVIAKTKRRIAKHVGAHTPKSRLPGSRSSPVKRKVSGEVVPRVSQAEAHRQMVATRFGGRS